ncbi:MAG: hypothetical protein V7K31_14485 [Nostoc sp.]
MAIPSLREACLRHAARTPTVSFANAESQEFIDSRADAREVRKALAGKLVYQVYKNSGLPAKHRLLQQ